MTTTLIRTLTVAVGVFAPGHLGELTRYLPFELVDDVLAQTRTMQQRLRALPSRTGVYFVLALGLFPRIGYARVWAKLCAGLAGAGMVVPTVSEKALRELRRRLGPAPFKALFEVVAGPLAQPRTPGVCFAGMRTVAFDGLNSLKIPDTGRNRAWIGRVWYRLAFAGYPTLRLMCLVETGTRGLLGAVIGGAIGIPGDRDEAHLARRLLHLLGPGMLLLADRAFDSATFLAQIHRTGAKLLIRAGCARKPTVLRRLSDGSYLSQLGGLHVRIIEAELTVRGADGTTVHNHYRLITTLLDDHRFPAEALIRLYHERWEIETAYLALRHTMLAGHVLRSQDRPGIEQEVWGLLTLYQLLRTAMVEAIETRPGLDPDRASFTTALQAARDQLITAQGIDPNPTTAGAADRLGAIGHAVLATLLPARRLRYSNRNVKCTTSRYHARDDGRPTRPTGIVAIDITVHTPQPNPAPTTAHPYHHRPPTPSKPSTPPLPTRRQLVTAILLSHPRRDWHGWELAGKLQVKTRNLLTQLAEWTHLGFIHRTGAGTYALNTPPPHWPPDYPADQLTTHYPGVVTARDRDQEQGTVQHSHDERPRATTSALHTHHIPGSDTPTASWT
jgi:hypothetical protein